MNNFGLKDVLKRFGPYFKDYIPHFILAFIGMALASGGTAVSAYLVEPVLNKIFVEKNETLLYMLPCAIIAIYVLKNIGTFMQAYFTAYIGQDTIRRFREKMVENLLNLDMKFFNDFRTGELISRTTNDIERIRSIVSSFIPELIRELVTIIGLLCVVIYQSPKLAFFALVVMPIAIYPISRLAKKMKKISKKSQEKTSDITSALSEIFTNIEIIKANNAQKYEHSRFVEENNKFFKLNLKNRATSKSTNGNNWLNRRGSCHHNRRQRRHRRKYKHGCFLFIFNCAFHALHSTKTYRKYIQQNARRHRRERENLFLDG